ncbi:hypothetical protein N9S24_01850 [SAR86 cluster bacterium]|jgi:hypothetical protein|nr:hypothetical protein [SAR86 cluster bacterium]|tara:strand:- start:331 stop:555 length:225 start_codon:yes stop_codon:yes gene_type:complete
MSNAKWEYKIVDHSNSTSMGYSNPETEEFKEKHKDKDWKLEMMNLAINKLGQEGWEMITANSSNEIYLKRKAES